MRKVKIISGEGPKKELLWQSSLGTMPTILHLLPMVICFIKFKRELEAFSKRDYLKNKITHGSNLSFLRLIHLIHMNNDESLNIVIKCFI